MVIRRYGYLMTGPIKERRQQRSSIVIIVTLEIDGERPDYVSHVFFSPV